MSKNNILVVEDDDELRQQMALYLEDNGYSVIRAPDAQALDQILAEQNVDVIVLDLGLPGEGGLSVCRRLDARLRPGILVVSAAGEETDRIIGLELGADDYLPKPFSPRELLARIKAMIRRHSALRQGSSRDDGIYRFAGFTYEAGKRRLLSPSGVVIALTMGECHLLSALLVSADGTVSRERLQVADDGMGRATDIVVSRLRKKFENHGASGIILTSRGKGYRLGCQVTIP
ncbi:response regulator [Asticcacaulis excentricus]|uniref:Two component transcriptional regulator, winged helix family n=1 Tax=Asticcacaulis excentricus (strain ATCC 15261 / DSM 4724 / KCTC 12464 / NCIMB 9791 / VKM B-1370 / CB 48) TaxID=573065 RepID=E8RS58_ASTEC|nr:response regulator [Asticcacaulis excentricus]ADU14329.1 two component transcriptional regulator, winged helix family [Asticcacaulis excentricus CB 48]